MEDSRELTPLNKDSFFTDQAPLRIGDSFKYDTSLTWAEVKRIAFDAGYLVAREDDADFSAVAYVMAIEYSKQGCGGKCKCSGGCACKASSKSTRRRNVQAILADPVQRRHLSILSGIAIQAREGRDVSYEEMAAAYDKVTQEQDDKVTRDD